MLDYQAGPVDRFRMQWSTVDEFCQTCSPPVPDFAMARLRLPASATVDKPYGLPVRSNASILLILQGHATSVETKEDLSFGQVLFLKAGQQLTVQVKGQQDLIVYQAFANVWTPTKGVQTSENDGARESQKKEMKNEKDEEKKWWKLGAPVVFCYSVRDIYYVALMDVVEYKNGLVWLK